ncbi:unnamed protein product [Closterium sp. NIES-65]|nr:unnamed protein product [Closterium sp. NIES-65]
MAGAAGLLPVLVLAALLLQAPSTASARLWIWNGGLVPFIPEQRAAEAVLTAAESARATGPAAGTVAAGTETDPPLSPPPVSAAAPTPAPTPAPAAAPAAAPAPAPAETCDDAPVDPSIVSGSAPDPCAALAAELTRSVEKQGNKTGGKWSQPPLSSRLATRHFCSEVRRGGLLSIANAFDNHYVYKHIAVDSPDQTNLPSSIDIVAELRKIVANGEKGKYSRLVDAHMAAYTATLALNDGHSMFVLNCFLGTYDLPLPLMVVVEDGKQIIRVAPRRCAAASDTSSPQATTLTSIGHKADIPVMDKSLKRHPDPVYYGDTSDDSDDLNVEIASLSAAADGSSGAVAGQTVTRISPKGE